MKTLRCLFALALILMFSGIIVSFADEDGTMSADNLGDGAEYGSGENRALEIDEAGDGDYDAGDGSVVETSNDADVGSDDTN